MQWYLQSGSLLEVCRANTLADKVVLSAARDEVQLLLIHDLFQLLAYLTHLHHTIVHHIIQSDAHKSPSKKLLPKPNCTQQSD